MKLKVPTEKEGKKILKTSGNTANENTVATQKNFYVRVGKKEDWRKESNT